MSTSTQSTRIKRYVTVDVRVDPAGRIRPLTINYDNHRIYGIDRILTVNRRTSASGSSGQCFTCLIHGKTRELWLEKGKWFVEAHCSPAESGAS